MSVAQVVALVGLAAILATAVWLLAVSSRRARRGVDVWNVWPDGPAVRRGRVVAVREVERSPFNADGTDGCAVVDARRFLADEDGGR